MGGTLRHCLSKAAPMRDNKCLTEVKVRKCYTFQYHSIDKFVALKILIRPKLLKNGGYPSSLQSFTSDKMSKFLFYDTNNNALFSCISDQSIGQAIEFYQNRQKMGGTLSINLKF